jgi:hypothetical protein
MADWMDDVLRDRLGRIEVSESANQLIREITERARTALANEPPEPSVRADFNDLIDRIVGEARSRRGFERRDQRSSEGVIVIDQVMVLTAMRGFCPKWPWC